MKPQLIKSNDDGKTYQVDVFKLLYRSKGSISGDNQENVALLAICACYYYDLADTVDSMTDVELEEIVTNSGNHLPECAEE